MNLSDEDITAAVVATIFGTMTFACLYLATTASMFVALLAGMSVCFAYVSGVEHGEAR